VRELKAQADQRDDDPVGEDQVMAGAGAGGTQPATTTAFVQPRFPLGGPWVGQLGDQRAQPPATDAGTDTMRQGRAGQS
jgi:hypothetical protein